MLPRELQHRYDLLARDAEAVLKALPDAGVFSQRRQLHRADCAQPFECRSEHLLRFAEHCVSHIERGRKWLLIIGYTAPEEHDETDRPRGDDIVTDVARPQQHGEKLAQRIRDRLHLAPQRGRGMSSGKRIGEPAGLGK